MFKNIRNWIVGEVFNGISNLSVEYKKVVTTIIITLSTIVGIIFGVIGVFVQLAETGCMANMTIPSLIAAGAAGIGFAFISIFTVGFISYCGFMAIPDWIIKIKNSKPTTIVYKIKIAKEWFVKYWPIFAILSGLIITFFLTCWCLGYTAWLIAC